MRHLSVAALMLFAVAVAGCARQVPVRSSSPQNPVGQVHSVGALRVKLESVSRDAGATKFVIVTTNSADTTQPAAFEHNWPQLRDAQGRTVEMTMTGGGGIHCTGVEGGGPFSAVPSGIGPDGRIETTASFKDPGPGSTLAFSPVSRTTAATEASYTVSWIMP